MELALQHLCFPSADTSKCMPWKRYISTYEQVSDLCDSQKIKNLVTFDSSEKHIKWGYKHLNLI